MNQSVWKVVDENTMIIVCEDIEDGNYPVGAGKKYVRASSIAFFKYERLPEVNDIPQTRVAYCIQVDLRGLIPMFITNSKIISQGAEALVQFEALFEEKNGWERSSRSFGLADSKVQVNTVDGKGWGSTCMNFRAEMEEVAAFFWDFGSRANIKISGDVERNLEEGEEGAGGFKKIVKRRQEMSSSHGDHHRDRSFTTAIEAKDTVAIRLRRLGGGRTKLELACEIELGFGVSRGAAKHFVKRRLEGTIDVSIYFQRPVPVKEYREADGVALGHDLLWIAPSGKKRVERLAEVLKASRAMKELLEELPWFEAMMAAALEGGVAVNRPVGTKLVCVSETEATQIERNLIQSLMTEHLAEAGVNEWRVQNRAVKELMAEEVWFEPMAAVLGKGIVKSAAWGLMARVIVGAVLSMTDLITDLFVLWQYWEGGERMLKYRNASLASLTMSIVLQLAVVVFIQNRKKGVRRILKGVAIVITGMKLAVDAYMVASGAEREKDTELSPMTEMTFCKCTEMFAESIPGIVIQTSAIINDLNSVDEVLQRSILSRAVSILTTGFVSATLSYDWDTYPKQRAAALDFYGYIPDSPRVRTIMFTLLTGISSVKVLLTALLVVSLGYIDVFYVWYFIGGDMLIYLAVKAVRGDFRYWVKIDGLTGLAISLLIRVVIKFIVDFAGTFRFSHPKEVGGLYFTLNLFTPVIGLALVLNLMPAETFNEVTAELLTKLAVGLGGGLLFLLGLFFTLMDEKYRRHF
ncbi:hypothetical protein TL16_g09141 [Triparma laevis f. inornata]|uniref:Uncharacterized protein n=1 Tax=Triparma laevis f. inornata TaxID=1714386 RepID=A0A9W7B1B1_9STRA|nr:hypothetical protein TL16_g09141 [Triparma laevis f. inornata]